MLRTSADFLYSAGRYQYPCFDTTLVRENGDIRSLRLEAQLFGRVRGGQWQARVYGYGSERGFPGPVIRRLSFPFSAERQTDQDLFVQGGWTQEWTARYSTALRFKYANNYTHYNTHPEKNPMALPYNLHYRQQSGYLSLAQSVVLAGPWSVDVSADVQRNALDSDVGQFVTPRRTTLTGVLATRLVWSRFRAAAHLVYQGAWDSFRTPSAGGWSRSNTYRDSWMPSLSLFWAPLPWLEADAFVKRTYRLPSFNDLYYSLMGNASLEPEAALQVGADVRLAFRQGAWQLSFRASPYYNRVSNKIVAIPTLSQFRWTMLNIGLVDITGADIKASASWHRGPWRVGGTLRYTFQQALDHSEPGSQTWGNQIPYIPRHSGSVVLEAGWRDLSFSWDSSFTGARWSRTANTPDYYLAPWSLSSAALQYAFHFRERGVADRPGAPSAGRALLLGVTIDNVFNTPYQVVQGYPMPGFSAQFSVSFRW
jgi:outer membrane receptor protein involved in Fe transport